MSECSGSQYEEVCKGLFEEIRDKLDRIDEALRGNGKLGIQVRLDRLETVRATQAKFIWVITGAIISMLVVMIRELIVRG